MFCGCLDGSVGVIVGFFYISFEIPHSDFSCLKFLSKLFEIIFFFKAQQQNMSQSHFFAQTLKVLD